MLLPVPLGAIDADPAARPDRDAHAVEHDVRPERLADVAGDEAGERIAGVGAEGRRKGTRRHRGGSSGREGSGVPGRYINGEDSPMDERRPRWISDDDGELVGGAVRRRPRRRPLVRAGPARRRRARALRPRRLRLLRGRLPPGAPRRLPVRRDRARRVDLAHGDRRRLPARRRELPARTAHPGAVRRVARARAPTSAARASTTCRSRRATSPRRRRVEREVRERRPAPRAARGLRGCRRRCEGATIGVDQLFGLAPGLAAAVGLTVLADDEEDA